MEPPRGADQLRNRVTSSKSPYVQSQAASPVSWQLLDDEAVSRAKAENKMIFMNIGYSACHCKLPDTFLLRCRRAVLPSQLLWSGGVVASPFPDSRPGASES